MKNATGHPLIFGEILYDVFKEGRKVLGGAPFNVAWHLRGFGLHPYMISRLGQDTLGEEALATLDQWQINRDAIQLDNHYPTGRVVVNLQKGIPTFHIPPNQAYDYIDAAQIRGILQSLPVALLYHGTLALRRSAGKEIIQDIINTLQVPVFLDLNLRHPWWQSVLIEDLIKQATWLKVNEEEIRILMPDFNLETADESLQNFCEQNTLKMVIVTLGAAGALLKQPNKPILIVSPSSVPIVDTVGAGDALSAVVIIGILFQWIPEQMLKNAVEFATAICQIPGATTMDKSLYATLSAQWGLA